jgi:hypothetical protein
LNQEKQLRELYEEHGGDVSAVARSLGLGDYYSGTGIPSPPPRRRQPPADLGREELRKYIVSARHVDSSVWPLEDEAKIDEARSLYEAGSHEMCQGRDARGWFVLYLIPRTKRAGARKFFHTEGV